MLTSPRVVLRRTFKMTVVEVSSWIGWQRYRRAYYLAAHLGLRPPWWGFNCQLQLQGPLQVTTDVKREAGAHERRG